MSGNQTIAEIHGLIETDPWQAPHDRPHQSGESPPQSDVPFVDPPDDDDPTIQSDSLTIFHRMVVREKRLFQVVAIDKTIPILAICMRNSRSGCWLAFTSLRVARRISTELVTAGFVVELEVCDLAGKLIS